MKRTALLFLLLACFVQDIYSHDPWFAVYSSYSFLKNPNVRMGLDFNLQQGGKLGLQIPPISVSIIQDTRNKKVYVSSNSISILTLAAAKLLDKDTQPYIVIMMIPAVISNFNLSYPVIPGMIKLNLRHNTDYFFFYKISKVCVETSLGLEADYKRTAITASVCMPWNKGYTGFDKAMHPFFSAGIKVNLVKPFN